MGAPPRPAQVYAFSSENWGRPAAEVSFLLALFERVLGQELPALARQGVRMRFIGELALLPQSLRGAIARWAGVQIWGRQAGKARMMSWHRAQRAGPPFPLCLAPLTAQCPPAFPYTRRAERETAGNAALHFSIAISYSGRQDLTQAVQEIAHLVAQGRLAPAQVRRAAWQCCWRLSVLAGSLDFRSRSSFSGACKHACSPPPPRRA